MRRSQHKFWPDNDEARHCLKAFFTAFTPGFTGLHKRPLRMINGKNLQFTTKSKCIRVIAVKWQISLWYDST